MTTQRKEKRRFPRLDCRIPLTLVSESLQALEVEGHDLSLTGVGIESEHATELRAGDQISVLIEGFPPVSAQVQWKEGQRIGLHFCEGIGGIVGSWVGDILASRGVVFREILPNVFPSAAMLL